VKRGEVNNHFSAAPQLKHFQFIVIGLEELDPEQTARLAERVCDCLFEHGAILGCISSLWIIGYWGILFDDDSAISRLSTVSHLLAIEGSLIRIAHGQCSGMVGNIGSKHRFTYSGLIPGLHEIREKLSEAEFGTAFEVPEKGAPQT
jgi:hypothetical protein